MSYSERRKEIVRLLRCGGIYTIKELADRFGVVRNTIKNDLLILTVDSGLPIDTKLGPGGGVHMTNFNHPHKHILSQDVISAINESIKTANTKNAKILSDFLRMFS